MSLSDDLHWLSSSSDLNVIEILLTITKSKIDTSKITADDLYRAAMEAWNTIHQKTINLLIDTFDARLLTCISLKGESLNGKRKLIEEYKKSIEDGNNLLKKMSDEKSKILEFVRRSRAFFVRLSMANQLNNHCNMVNCNESEKIVNLLPARLLKKMGIPKPMVIESV